MNLRTQEFEEWIVNGKSPLKAINNSILRNLRIIKYIDEDNNWTDKADWLNDFQKYSLLMGNVLINLNTDE